MRLKTTLMTEQRLKVALIYTKQDRDQAIELSQRLDSEEFIKAWHAEDDILPGQHRKTVFEETIQSADIVIICCSNNGLQAEGIFHEDMRYANNIALQKPPRTIFRIIVKLDECQLPYDYGDITPQDYFGIEKERSYERIKESIKTKKQNIGYLQERSNDIDEKNQEKYEFEHVFETIKKIATTNQSIDAINEDDNFHNELIKTVAKITPGYFVGRKSELQRVLKLLDEPYGKKRIVYLEGIGGIGKTMLIVEILERILRERQDEFLVPYRISDTGEVRPQIIDFYTTDNRSLDGVRETLIQHLDPSNEHFVEYRQPQRNTQAVFRKCLQILVNKKPVLLAFDTFELVHNDPLVYWLFDDSEDGLQMPGLVCLIGSRPAEKIYE